METTGWNENGEAGFAVAENLMIVAVAAILLLAVFAGLNGITGDVMNMVRDVLSL